MAILRDYLMKRYEEKRVDQFSKKLVTKFSNINHTKEDTPFLESFVNFYNVTHKQEIGIEEALSYQRNMNNFAKKNEI